MNGKNHHRDAAGSQDTKDDAKALLDFAQAAKGSSSVLSGLDSHLGYTNASKSEETPLFQHRQHDFHDDRHVKSYVGRDG